MRRATYYEKHTRSAAGIFLGSVVVYFTCNTIQHPAAKIIASFYFFFAFLASMTAMHVAIVYRHERGGVLHAICLCALHGMVLLAIVIVSALVYGKT